MSATASVLLNRILAGARLKHLQVLLKVAEVGSFKRAGQAIGLTQPAVTHVVADLERLLDVELFQRHARGVTPTAFCLELVPTARQIVHSLGLGMEAIVARREQGRGSVRVGATAAAITGFLADAVPAFNSRQPDVAVQISEFRPDELALMVGRGELDVVACRAPGAMPEGWGFKELMKDRFVVACGGHHPMAKRKRLRFVHLASEQWLATPVSTTGRRVLDDMFAQREVTARYAHVSTIAVPLTIALLMQRRLLTLVPYSVVKPFVQFGQLAVLRVEEPLAPLASLGLLLPTAMPSFAAGLLVEFLQSAAAATLPSID